MKIIATDTIASALIAEGFPLPDNCRELRVRLDATGPAIIEYTVLLSTEDVVLLSRALARAAQEAS